MYFAARAVCAEIYLHEMRNFVVSLKALIGNIYLKDLFGSFS